MDNVDGVTNFQYFLAETMYSGKLKPKELLVLDDDKIEYGKRAITNYEVLSRLNYVTLVKCFLETGRTHQIRVHMKYIGHTLFNDERYGGNSILKGTTFTKYKQFVENCFKETPL